MGCNTTSNNNFEGDFAQELSELVDLPVVGTKDYLPLTGMMTPTNQMGPVQWDIRFPKGKHIK